MDRVRQDEVEAILDKLRSELEGLAAKGSPVARDILDQLCTDDDNACRHGGRWCDRVSRSCAAGIDAPQR